VLNTELVESALSAHGRRLVVLDDGEVDDDLVRDVVEVLTSFSVPVLHGRRSARNRALRVVGWRPTGHRPAGRLSVGPGRMRGVGDLEIDLPRWPRRKPERVAVEHSIDVALSRDQMPGDAPVDRLVVNMLRHEFTNYDADPTREAHRAAR
jgi:hypothetical protein